TVETLDALTDTGLLESSGEDRYTLHQTIADYAHSHLKEDTIVYERLITYVFSYVEAHKKDYELLGLEFNIVHAAIVETRVQHLIGAIIGVRVQEGKQDAHFAVGKLLLRYQLWSIVSHGEV